MTKVSPQAPDYIEQMRTPIKNDPDPMYAEFEVHRTMIRDTVRTEAFRRAIDSVVRPGDVVLDVGAGSGILSVFAARAGAARVYAVERTTIAVLAQELAAANGFADIVEVIQVISSTSTSPNRSTSSCRSGSEGSASTKGCSLRSSQPVTVGSSRAGP